MLSRTLANYIAFPFPFAKKPSVKHSSSYSGPSSSSSRDRKLPGRKSLSLGGDRQSPNSSSTSRVRQALPPSLLVGYVGEYWRKTSRGTFVPLSLVDCCIRSIAMRLIHDPESAMLSCEPSDEDDDDDDRLKAVAIPTELATAILKWLKDHEQLEREQFQLLAPFLTHEWSLSGLAEVDESWFVDVPSAPLQQLRSIDVSGCHQLQHIVGARRSSLDKSTETFPSLAVANFRGCAQLSPSVVDLLQFSPFLVSLTLAGCRNVDDRNLLALRRLVLLETLDLVRCASAC